MNDFHFETVWPNPSDEVRAEVILFWQKETAMSGGVAEERASQLLVVARDIDDQVAAVSTAVPWYVERIGLPTFYFRAFVSKSHRVCGLRPTGLIQQVMLRSFRSLERRYHAGDDSAVGLYLEVQNQNLLRHRKALVWNELGANIVYIGPLPNGAQARIWYFGGATMMRRD